MNNNEENNVKALHIILQLIVLFIIIGAGAGAYNFFIKNRPEVKKTGKKKARPVYVDVKSFKKKNTHLVIEAMGEVSPEKEINLRSSVSGEIVSVSKNFYPGGIVKKGEIILQIDKRDYLIALEKAKTQVEKAKADLDLEIGQQKSAGKELLYYEKSGMAPLEDKSLALREPQLKSAKADLQSALAELKSAKLDLSRTEVKAPFDAIITQTNVNLGSYVSSQENLALLYGTYKFWVKGFVPSDRVKFLKNKNGRLKADVKSLTSDTSRKGIFKSFTGVISQDSRMAEIIVEIKDPLGLESDIDPLISGDYTSISIAAENIENVFMIPRQYVHNNHYLWIYKDKKLEIRNIEIFWKDSKNVLIKQGLNEDDKVVTSSISIPVNDMPLIINKPEKKSGKTLVKD